MRKISLSLTLVMVLTVVCFFGVCQSAIAQNVRPYTDAEQQMVDATNKAADEMMGWKKGGKFTVTAESLKTWGNCIDYWNPLWDDEAYAADTRYGSIIAAPYYLSGGGWLDMVKTPGVGTWGGQNNGGLGEFLKPVRPGDEIRIWVERPIIEDVTEGDGPRTFRISTTTCFINQHDELVYKYTTYLTNTFRTESTGEREARGPGLGRGEERHVYTDEDWEEINRIADAEVIRGDKIRFWEDVQVGDMPAWVINEPTTVIDIIKFNGRGVMKMLPIREVNKEIQKELYQDEYGVYHWNLEHHFVGRDGGRSSHYMAFGKQVMARLVTNWMGDDGWLKRANTKDYGEHENVKGVNALKGKTIRGGHGSEGDAVIAKAEVTRKYIENGEHLVDLVVWTESFTGTIWQNMKATVRLVSREDEIQWK